MRDTNDDPKPSDTASPASGSGVGTSDLLGAAMKLVGKIKIIHCLRGTDTKDQ